MEKPKSAFSDSSVFNPPTAPPGIWAENANEAVEKCNERFFSVRIGPDLRFGEYAQENGTYGLKVRGHDTDHPVLYRLMSKQSLFDDYSHLKVYLGQTKQDEPIIKPAVRIWLDSPVRNHYYSVENNPRMTEAGKPGTPDKAPPLQLFEGIENPPALGTPFAEMSEEGRSEIEMLLKVLLRGAFGNDKKAFQFFMTWAARIIAEPWERTDVLVSITGEAQGVGKTFACNLLAAILGKKNCLIGDGLDDKLTRFSAKAATCLLYIGEETAKVPIAEMGALKKAVTGDVNGAEEKGVAKVYVANFSNFLITANSDPLPGESSERRYARFQCATNTYKASPAFKDKFEPALKKFVVMCCKNSAENTKLLRDLARYIVDNHKPKKDCYLQHEIPKSEQQAEALEESLASRSHGVTSALRPLLLEARDITYAAKSAKWKENGEGVVTPSYLWPRATAENPCFVRAREAFKGDAASLAENMSPKQERALFFSHLMEIVNRQADERGNKTKFVDLRSFVPRYFMPFFNREAWKHATKKDKILTYEFALLSMLRCDDVETADARYADIVKSLREVDASIGGVPLEQLKSCDKEFSYHQNDDEKETNENE